MQVFNTLRISVMQAGRRPAGWLTRSAMAQSRWVRSHQAEFGHVRTRNGRWAPRRQVSHRKTFSMATLALTRIKYVRILNTVESGKSPYILTIPEK